MGIEQAKMRTYLLIDAAQSFDIRFALEGLSCKYQGLMSGMDGSDQAGLLPYLVELEAYSSATEWYFDTVYGKDWGILISTYDPADKLTRDLKKFVRCNYLGISNALFRFYRPKTFHAFVHALDRKDLENMIKDRFFYAETSNSKGINRYVIENGELNILGLRKIEMYDFIHAKQGSLQ